MEKASIQLDYVSSDDLRARHGSWWSGVLGVVGYAQPPQLDDVPIPVTASMTPVLGGTETLCEVWRVRGGRDAAHSIPADRQGGVHFRHCDDLLFGSITVHEGRFPGNRSVALKRATTAAYREIFDVLEKTQHRHLLRVWNTLPEINGESDGDERYRHFNAARQAAFRHCGRNTLGTVPAASALGSPAGSPISIYFLASSREPTMIENPRQTSAYHYPPQFGAHSPTFSRASVLSHSIGTNLFVSGTASIIGHETVHLGDVTAQTCETLKNIDAVLGEANRLIGADRFSLASLKFKVYVRRPADRIIIERTMASALPASTAIVYLKADVCREELLVEIEAIGESRHS
jgi:chorismate lyase/3-hydroxybenzoate synthase